MKNKSFFQEHQVSKMETNSAAKQAVLHFDGALSSNKLAYTSPSIICIDIENTQNGAGNSADGVATTTHS